jgi:2-dehydro-3-deoxy-D-gluconate 5-dehydrogenase
MKNLFDISGRVALVTGGRRGLGKAMTLGLLEAGAKVVVVARSSDDGGLQSEASKLGGELIYIQADLSKRQERANLVERVVGHFGQIDILVNNAGLQHRSPVLEYADTIWDADIELLLTAVLDLSQQAGRVMVKQGGGKIVQIASISSFQGARNIIGYASAKHALVGLTKCLANELASQNVNVNAIAPGLFETDMAENVMQDTARANELRGRIPAGRFGQPFDMVGPLLFLASDASRHVHGHVLLVDGGWMGR